MNNSKLKIIEGKGMTPVNKLALFAVIIGVFFIFGAYINQNCNRNAKELFSINQTALATISFVIFSVIFLVSGIFLFFVKSKYLIFLICSFSVLWTLVFFLYKILTNAGFEALIPKKDWIFGFGAVIGCVFFGKEAIIFLNQDENK